MNRKLNKLTRDVANFLEAEKEELNKSNGFMKKLYQNKIKNNKAGDREIIWFLFDEMALSFYEGTMTEAYVDKLFYGWIAFLGDEIIVSVDNYLELRKTELNRVS